MGTSYLQDSVKQLEVFEGRVPWLYLDSKGHVTVGVGLMLPNLAAALALPLRSYGMGEDPFATPEQVTGDFNRISGMEPNHAPSYYHSGVSVFLETEDIDSLLLKTVTSIDEWIPSIYPAYATWPDCAKLAILDMGYNLGEHKLSSGYPHMNLYLNAPIPNFIGASMQCGRDTSDPAFNARNRWTQQQFLEAS